MKNEIAFTGEAIPAQCECHKGKFTVVVYQILPLIGKIACAAKHFDDPAEAASNVEKFTEETAKKVLSGLGLSMESAKEVRRAHGADAEKEEHRIHRQARESDTRLH